MRLHDIEPENEDILGYLSALYQNLRPFVRNPDGTISYGRVGQYPMGPEEEAIHAKDVRRWIEQGRPATYNHF